MTLTDRTREAVSPPGPGPGRRLGLVLAACCLGQFMNVLDTSVVNVALPVISRALHFDRHNLQLVNNACTVVVCGFLLLGGRLADLFGGRRIFLCGSACSPSPAWSGSGRHPGHPGPGPRLPGARRGGHGRALFGAALFAGAGLVAALFVPVRKQSSTPRGDTERVAA